MDVAVVRTDEGHRLSGDGPITEVANRYLAHLGTRSFSPATVRGYAFDLLNFSRFLRERGAALADVIPTDLFDWLDWQAKQATRPSGKVVRISERRGPAPATMNRRVAAVRGLFEYAVITDVRADNPVPPGRRSTGLRAPRRGMLRHLGSHRTRSNGRLVRQDRRLPESLDPDDVATFLADLETHRDRAIVCYARLASPTVRTAYEAAMGKVRARSALVIRPGRPTAVPSRVDWLAAEMLKTRVAHSYCSREQAAGPCAYANICEQCDNFIAGAEIEPVIRDQLADVVALRDDPAERGWDDEVARHERVIASVEEHLRRFKRTPHSQTGA